MKAFRVSAIGTLLASLALAQSASAQSGNMATKTGFALPKDGSPRILLFQPEVIVAEETTGGLAVPNADWTVEAREQLTKALVKTQTGFSNELKIMPEFTGRDANTVRDYRALFKIVVNAALKHRLLPGEMLATKKGSFDWTLGSGAARLGKLGDGDYALFVVSNDAYNSRGRRAVEAISEVLGRDSDAGTHSGYAGLVDLKTGDLVWINANMQMTGDVRTPEGASSRAAQLLQGFPKRGK